MGGCPPAPHFDVFGARGDSVALRSACDPLPDCPAITTPLNPGKSATQTLVFDGTTWDQCHKQKAPAGRYEVVVTFYYRTTDRDRIAETTTSTSFDWGDVVPPLQAGK
jgi:hypothetical protein